MGRLHHLFKKQPFLGELGAEPQQVKGSAAVKHESTPTPVGYLLGSAPLGGARQLLVVIFGRLMSRLGTKRKKR